MMRLRLYHHPDGTRVAYRESGTGPALCLLHSAMLSHREWEPIVGDLQDRFRVVLPDLPMHGDSENHPRHPYTLQWLAQVMAGFSAEVLGPRPRLGGRDMGAQILLEAVLQGAVTPQRLVLMPNSLHGEPRRANLRRAWRLVSIAGSVPGMDRLLSHGTRLVFTPELGERLSERSNPSARDLLRHAFADVPGNSNLARSWAKWSRQSPRRARADLLGQLEGLDMPVLLLWADRDPLYPLSLAEEALARLPAGQLRVLESTGFLMAYDDPVGLARELAAFLT